MSLAASSEIGMCAPIFVASPRLSNAFFFSHLKILLPFSRATWYVDGPSYVAFPLALWRKLSAWFCKLFVHMMSRFVSAILVDICVHFARDCVLVT